LVGGLEVVVVVCWSLRVDCVMKVLEDKTAETLLYTTFVHRPGGSDAP
jgi:hypothetical protein